MKSSNKLWIDIQMTIGVLWGLSWILSGFGLFAVAESISSNQHPIVIVLAFIYSIGGFVLAYKFHHNSKDDTGLYKH